MAYIGWLGAIIFIVAYLLLSLEYISAKKYFYHLLNVLGAICLVINAIVIDDYPNIFVNGIWGIIALLAVYKRYEQIK
ncbi:MAG: hypothetical protein V7767_14020 [Leeuwenhoekiella sp.]